MNRRLPPGNAAGFTSTTPKGVISGVYLEGNFPGEKLGNCAMHEIMHLKLDVGQTKVPDIHALNAATNASGISDDGGINASTKFTAAELTPMAANRFDPVAVFTDGN